MRVYDHAAGDNKAPGQLHRVSHGRPDDVTFERRGGPGAQHGGRVGDLAPAAARKAVRPVRLPLWVGEGLEGNGARLEERLHVFVRALPDNGDTDPFSDEFLVTVAQLREMPAAERSAVVAEKAQSERPVHP